MSIKFLAIASVMALAALAMLTRPWLRLSRQRIGGFAKLPVLIAVIAVGLAVAVYITIGRPDAIGSTDTQADAMTDVATWAQNAAPDSRQTRVDSIASLVGGLEERVIQQPDNGKDWLLLAKSYDHLGRPEEALNAYEKAAALGVADATIKSKLADQHYTTSAAEPITIKGQVSLSSAAAELVQPTDTVFVLAREVGGPPMPLAVIRRSAAELPIDFELSDKNTMVAGRGISSVSKLIVEAKISASGDAFSTKAGLIASSADIEPANAPFLTLVVAPGKSPTQNNQ